MVKPKIVINGKEIVAGNPKAIVWRHMSDFSFSEADDVVLDMSKLIAETFNREDVNSDVILENVDLQDITALYRDCCSYVLNIFTAAMENIGKNGQSGAGV